MVVRVELSKDRSLFLDRDVIEPNGFGPVDLHLDYVLLLVERDLRERRHLAFTLPVFHVNLNEQEGVIGRPRIVDRFPEAHLAVGGHDNPFTAVGQRFVPRIFQIPPQSVVLGIGAAPARDVDPTFGGQLLQRPDQIVLSFGHGVQEVRALLLRGPPVQGDLDDAVRTGQVVAHVDGKRAHANGQRHLGRDRSGRQQQQPETKNETSGANTTPRHGRQSFSQLGSGAPLFYDLLDRMH